MLTTNGHAHTHSAYSTTCAERFCRMIALVSEPPKKEMERNRVVCARRARWWEAVDANIGAIRRNHTATTLSLALLNSLSRSISRSISRFSENLWSFTSKYKNCLLRRCRRCARRIRRPKSSFPCVAFAWFLGVCLCVPTTADTQRDIRIFFFVFVVV